MDEEQLAQEVLYLHSLWYIGPPNPSNNPNPYPNVAPNSTPHPNFARNSTPYPHFAPNSTPHRNFAPNSTPYSNFAPNYTHNSTHYPNFTPQNYHYPNSSSNYHLSYPNPNPRPHYNPNPSSTSILPYNTQPKKQRTDPSEEKEWPCDPASLPGQSEPATWPSPAQNPKPSAPPLSPDSSSRSALLSMQFPAIQACKSFFSNSDSDSDPNPDSDSDSESEKQSMDLFFKGLFENDVGLRVCYEKDHDKGEFYCLVCEAQKEGKKGKGARYKGCIALTQHASTVLKAGWTGPHRAFARAVCGVLGWDETRLPSIVLLPRSVLKVSESNKEITKDPTPNPNPNSPRKEPTKDTTQNPNPNSPSSPEWPSCPTPFPNPNPPATWAATLAAAPPPPGTTAQQEALAKARHIQRRAIRSTKRFLSLLEEEYSDSDSDSDFQAGFDSVKVNSPDVDLDFGEEWEGEERPDMEGFFANIFEKDPKLREYYERNVEKGDFFCFVCQVRKDFKRKGMRYKSGVALTQHASTVSKEGGRGAHRALAKVLCRVFGWDPLCLPGSVKEVGEVSEKDEKFDGKVEEESDGNSNGSVGF